MKIFSNLSTNPRSDLRPPSGVHCHTPVRSPPNPPPAPARCAITRPVQFGSGSRSRKPAPSLHLGRSNYNLLKSRYPTPRGDNDGASSLRPARLLVQHNTPVNKDSVAGRKIQLYKPPSLCLDFTFFRRHKYCFLFLMIAMARTAQCVPTDDDETEQDSFWPFTWLHGGEIHLHNRQRIQL